MQAKINYNHTIEVAKLLEQKLKIGQKSSNIVELETSNENEERIAVDDSESKESAKEAERLFLKIKEMKILSNELLVDLKHPADNSIEKCKLADLFDFEFSIPLL
ncbi:3830_t:CDS:2, partial [Racocetra persica]